MSIEIKCPQTINEFSELAAEPEISTPPTPIPDLFRSIIEAEESLAKTRNILQRRIATEPMTSDLAASIANLAAIGEAHAQTARRRYRRIESTLSHVCPSFGIANGLDWRRAGDAALKLALSCANRETPLSLDEAINVLTADELDSYAFLRRGMRRSAGKQDHRSAAA